jgi:hypothetical protein
VNYELKGMWKEAIFAELKVVFRNLSRRTKENHEKPFRIAGVRAEI